MVHASIAPEAPDKNGGIGGVPSSHPSVCRGPHRPCGLQSTSTAQTITFAQYAHVMMCIGLVIAAILFLQK